MNALKTFWYNHVQKTIGTILLGLAGFDFTAALAGYEHDISNFVGTKVYSGLRVIGLAAIVYRAITHQSAPTPPT